MYSFVKSDLWDAGMRFIPRETEAFPQIVQSVMKEALGITCPSFQEMAFGFVEKIVIKKMKDVWHNRKSHYRSKLREMCEYFC